MFNPGDTVQCFMGRGQVIAVREDGIYVVQLLDCKLANGKLPLAYMQGSTLHIPSSKVFAVGDRVKSAYGEGTVQRVRWDGVYQVSSSSWSLANEQKPTLFLQSSALERIPPKLADDDGVDDKLSTATDLKNQAAKLFKAKSYAEAKEKYIQALAYIQYAGSDLSNGDKARVIELSVPIHNNVASCNIRMKKYKDVVGYAQNALNIIRALAQRTPSSKVLAELLKRGVTEDKIFLEWKSKSLFLLGKALCVLGESDAAKMYLEEAQPIARGDNREEIDKLLVMAIENSKKEKKAAKRMWNKAWQAMDKENKQEAEGSLSLSTNTNGYTHTHTSGQTDSPSHKKSRVGANPNTSPTRRLKPGKPKASSSSDALPWLLLAAGIAGVCAFAYLRFKKA